LLNAGNQKRTKTLKKMKSSIIQDDEERFKDEFLSMSDNPDDSPGNERMFDDTMITKKTFTHLPNEMKPANRRQKQSIISVSDVLGFEKRQSVIDETMREVSKKEQQEAVIKRAARIAQLKAMEFKRKKQEEAD